MAGSKVPRRFAARTDHAMPDAYQSENQEMIEVYHELDRHKSV
jgi:hypothetical protein